MRGEQRFRAGAPDSLPPHQDTPGGGAQGALDGPRTLAVSIHEVSGVASLGDGRFAVVGDDDVKSFRIVDPIDGEVEHPFPSELIVEDAESIEYGVAGGEELWLFLSENESTIHDQSGGEADLESLTRKCLDELGFYGERLYEKTTEDPKVGWEGLALMRRGDAWRVAALYEGGLLDKANLRDPEEAYIALMDWTPGRDVEQAECFRLDVPVHLGQERFRATDLVWSADGESFYVLLGSETLPLDRKGKYDPKGKRKHSHTWIVQFDGSGKRLAAFKMEESAEWKRYREGKNFEALDWVWGEEGRQLVIGEDKKKATELRIFASPFQ